MKLADALIMVACTDPGRVRSQNEDAIFADASLGLAILADGMGGYKAGEVASGMAATLLASNFSALITTQAAAANGVCDRAFAEREIDREVAQANQAIFNAAQRQPQYAGMGTTLVLAWFYDNQVSVAHIGDSRLYRLRGEQLEQLTRDHSFLQEQLDSGMITPEAARFSHNRNLVTRALGVEASVQTEIRDYEVQVGDLILLCSDGLSDMVEDAEISFILKAQRFAPSLAAEQLVQLANAKGGRDNISVILIQVRGDYATPRGWWQRLLARFR